MQWCRKLTEIARNYLTPLHRALIYILRHNVTCVGCLPMHREHREVVIASELEGRACSNRYVRLTDPNAMNAASPSVSYRTHARAVHDWTTRLALSSLPLCALSEEEKPLADSCCTTGHHDAHSALWAGFGHLHPCFRGRLVVRLMYRCRV